MNTKERPYKEVIVCLKNEVADKLDSTKENTGIPKSRTVQDALKHFWECDKHD